MNIEKVLWWSGCVSLFGGAFLGLFIEDANEWGLFFSLIFIVLLESYKYWRNKR